jgi:hypothetical protein
MNRSAKNSAIFALTLLVTFFIGFAAYAEDIMLNASPTDVVSKLDKNGSPYVRMIIQEDKELNGVAYKSGVPVMFFGDLVAKAKAVKPGQAIKVIASKGDYKGKTSYTAISFIE